MTDEPGYVVKRRGVIGSARAYFSCNSPTCRTKKGARVYELPAATVRCGVCGSKKIQRLMSGFNVSKGIAKRTDQMVQPEYTRQQQKRDKAKEQQRQTPMLAVDPKKHGGLSGAISHALGVNVQLPGAAGAAKPTLGITSPELAGIKAQGAVSVPREVVGRWKPSADDLAAARRGK
jgi:hypothetical protein